MGQPPFFNFRLRTIFSIFLIVAATLAFPLMAQENYLVGWLIATSLIAIAALIATGGKWRF